MSCETHCCVLSRGEFFLADWKGSCVGGLSELFCGPGPNKPFKKLGNVSSALVEISAEVLGKENKFNPISDTCARQVVRGVNITVSLACASKENLIRALYSDRQVSDSGNHVVDYCIDSLDTCDFFPFERQQAKEDSLTVYLRNPRGIVVAVLEPLVDYQFTPSGIKIIRDDIDLDGASKLRLAYQYDNQNFFEMEFLRQFQGYKEIFFKGTNYGDGEQAMFDARFYKVLFAPVETFDLITQDGFLTLTLRGSVEEDQDKWFKITKQEA